MASRRPLVFPSSESVLALWLVALIGFGALDRSVGRPYANNFSLPATDSSRALDVLKANFPAQAGDSEQIVIQAKDGHPQRPGDQGRGQGHARQGGQLPHVRAVTSPYELGGQISKDGTIGLATVYLDALAQNVPKDAVTDLITPPSPPDSRAPQRPARRQRHREQRSRTASPPARRLGILFALIILFFAFRRSFLCALCRSSRP